MFMHLPKASEYLQGVQICTREQYICQCGASVLSEMLRVYRTVKLSYILQTFSKVAEQTDTLHSEGQ